ncbi:MAG: PTS galactitol transporter subunit IIC [Clostridia bacterium]
MNIVGSIFNYISNLGSSVVVPIMFMLVAIVFGLGLKKAYKIGITIGIGFIGLNLVIGLFWQFLSPVAALLAEKFGLHMQYVDTGWMTGSAIGFASPVGAFIIPFALLINIILLSTNLTKTLNVDIWNFWHYCFYGGIAYALTGSIIWGYVMAGVMAAISLKFGDIGAKYIEKEMGVPGISVPQCFAASTLPLGLILDKIYSYIPGLNSVNVSPKKLSEKIGIFGEPATIGLMLGVILSIAVGYDLAKILQTGLGLASLMFLLPRMVKVLMEGLLPLSEAAKAFMQKSFKGKDFYIGLDSAITLANPTTVVVSVLLVPITLLVSLLPFNGVLPGADLAAGAYYVCLFSLIHKGDLIKTTISGTILMILVYLFMTIFAPMVNQLALAAHIAAGSEGLGIAAGVNVMAGPLLLPLKYFGNNFGPILLLILGVIVFVLASKYENHINKKLAATISSENTISIE